MAENATLLQSLSPQDLGTLIDERLKAQLELLQNSLVNHSAKEELLTREEAYTFLKVDSTTLWAWTKKGKITAYGLGARRYYKRSELLDCLKPVK